MPPVLNAYAPPCQLRLPFPSPADRISSLGWSPIVWSAVALHFKFYINHNSHIFKSLKTNRTTVVAINKDFVQPLSNEDDTMPDPPDDENEDLEKGHGPREAKVITVDMTSSRQRPVSRSRGTFLGLGDSLHSSGISASLGLDLDPVGVRSGESEDEEDDEHPIRPIPSTLSMLSAASGYVRRPSIHDTSAMDELRQSLNHGRLSRSASKASLASMVTRKNSSHNENDSSHNENDDVEEQDRQEDEEEEEETDPHSKRFRRAIIDACHDAFGVLGVDVWLHDEEDGSFHHAPGG
ncbi:hypothetical protein THAOC_05967, partial [Thalassiosira oceanica]